jgi:hypothetical protein
MWHDTPYLESFAILGYIFELESLFCRNWMARLRLHRHGKTETAARISVLPLLLLIG